MLTKIFVKAFLILWDTCDTCVAALHSFCADQTDCYTQMLILKTSNVIELSVGQSVIVIIMYVCLHVSVIELYSKQKLSLSK